VLHLWQAAPDVAVQPEQAVQQEQQDHPEEATNVEEGLHRKDCREETNLSNVIVKKYKTLINKQFTHLCLCVNTLSV